ncbi:MAG: M56 family metallopeptidase [Planctomycetota bacterium]
MPFDFIALSWWNGSIQIAWQAGALFLVICLLDAASRRLPQLQQMHASRWRVMLWSIFFVKLMIPPELSSNWSVWNLFDSSAAAAAWAPPATTSTDAGSFHFTQIIFSLWAIGSIALALQLWIQSRRFFVHLKQCPLLDHGSAASRASARAARKFKLKSVPEIRWSGAAQVPCVVRPLKPVVVLPAHYDHKSETELLHVLLHEFAHISRRDLIYEAAARFLTILYWYHPAVWIARRQFSLAREVSCDLTVARALGGEMQYYQKTLVRIAAETLWIGRTAPGGPVSASGAPTMERLRFIETLTLTKQRSLLFTKSAFAGHLLFAFISICCVLPAARDDEFAFRVAAANRLLESVTSGNRESCLRIQMAARVLAMSKGQDTNTSSFK